MPNKKHVEIDKDTWKWLQQYKLDHDLKSMDEVIKKLISSGDAE